MTTTHRNPHSGRARLGLGAAVTAVIAISGACIFEVDDDRAAVRRIAERVERSVERHADDGSSIDVDAVASAIEIVFGAAVLDDIAAEDELTVNGLSDADVDGRDDDGRIEISVADAVACLEFADGRATFRVEPCAS
jgi:hypothetical protein